MPRLLYISPYFPPQARVGAMRPLKFVRHLHRFGWESTVLCDMWPGAKTAEGMLEHVPAGVEVVCDYSHRARRALAGSKQPPSEKSRPSRSFVVNDWMIRLPGSLANPELIPLGEHSLHMPHARRAAQRLLDAKAYDAIMVNADPWAALLVGAGLARRNDLPLIADLRDPWAPCELRRPLRPRWIRALVDRMERHVVNHCQRVICNTEQSQRAYRALYSDLPPSRFEMLRNSCDTGLTEQLEDAQALGRFTLLFMGQLRPFVEGNAILETLSVLSERGLRPDEMSLLVTGSIPSSVRDRARAMGVGDYLVQGRSVPYAAIGSLMASADLLVLQGHETNQRIPAKLYDYLSSERPILALADNPEIESILDQSAAGRCIGLGDPEGAADFVERYAKAGRYPVLPRSESFRFDSIRSTERLASILDEARASGSRGMRVAV